MTIKHYIFILLCLGGILSAKAQLRVGAERMEVLLPLLQNKRIALMGNQSSVVGSSRTHLLDTLISRGVDVRKIFVPEHGFRGTVDAGKYVRNGRDTKSGLPIISLYGRQKRPTQAMLSDVDIILFDLQDVGARFYTYISSLHYIMEAAQELDKTVVVCDRPNPNDYIDGPILEQNCRSFIGMHPIPVMHGLTVGELAQMINGERWLRSGKTCSLEVVTIEGWKHGQAYSLPVRPSPNLPDDKSVKLYPSLCFFEATIMSVGRGTDKPFRQIGYPHKEFGKHHFTPRITLGADTNPKYQGKKCYGIDLSKQKISKRLSLRWLIDYHQRAKSLGLKLIDRRRTFELLTGNKALYHQLEQGLSEDEIRATWQSGLKQYTTMRQRYLLYP